MIDHPCHLHYCGEHNPIRGLIENKQQEENREFNASALPHLPQFQASMCLKNVTAVDNVTLKAEEKEFLALVGPSGCGKTTTLRMIAGLEEPTGGDIHIGERKVNNVPPKDRGLIMQIGTPLEVYDNPENLFVAGFIGSPAMKFLEARVTEENGSLFVTGDHFRLLVPGQAYERLDRKGFSNIYIMSSQKNKDPKFSRKEIVPFAET